MSPGSNQSEDMHQLLSALQDIGGEKEIKEPAVQVSPVLNLHVQCSQKYTEKYALILWSCTSFILLKIARKR